MLTFIMASAASAHAYDFSAVCNTGQTLYYNILSDSTVAVTYPNYSNESYYYGYIKPSGTLQIPATVSHGGSSYRVISLGNNAFYSCTGLMAVSIPSSVSIIGDGTFYNCTALSSIVIPDNVTTIGVAAFQSCSNLHSLHLGNSVATIASVAFEGCSSLTSLSILPTLSFQVATTSSIFTIMRLMPFAAILPLRGNVLPCPLRPSTNWSSVTLCSTSSLQRLLWPLSSTP